MNPVSVSLPVATSGLVEFQRAFAQALLDPDAEPRGPAGQPAFAVYRNTVSSGCIDALEANYPVVAALVGRDWFREAAAAYVRRSPPVDVRLMNYGGDLDQFLAALPAAAELPFLPAVALLERLWRESHMAADAPVLDVAALRALSAGSLAGLRPVLHPALRWHWFDDAPATSLWRAHQTEDDAQCRAALEALDRRAEGALLTRPHGRVLVALVGRPACAFLDACARSATLAVALAAAAEVGIEAGIEADAGAGTQADAGASSGDDAFDVAALLRQLIGSGALCGFETP